MGQTDQESDPRRKIPTFLWLALGAVAVVLFVLMAMMMFGHMAPRAIGPPAGAPPAVGSR